MNQYILYLENEKSDIEMFARLMAKLTDQPFEGVEEGAVQKFLWQCNVDLCTSYEEARKCIDQRTHRLYILDCMLDSHETAYDLIPYIRQKDDKNEIWILSQLAYLNESYVKNRGANRFFSKQKPTELENALRNFGESRNQNMNPRIVIGTEMGKEISMDGRQIIYIKKNYEFWDLWRFGAEKGAINQRIRPYHSMIEWIQYSMDISLQAKMMKVQKDCIINVDMIEDIQKQNGTLYVKLRQVPEWIRISRSFKKEFCRRLLLDY